MSKTKKVRETEWLIYRFGKLVGVPEAEPCWFWQCPCAVCLAREPDKRTIVGPFMTYEEAHEDVRARLEADGHKITEDRPIKIH